MSANAINEPGPAVAGRFERLSLLGCGGMGVVWRALDHETGDFIALKLMAPLEGHDDVGVLEREAGFLVRIAHAAVPRYVDHGTTREGVRYLAMELLDGEDLLSRLERGPLDVDAAIALGARVAEALAAVHAAGVVHCDLKPSNLFLPRGEVLAVKILDFGIARFAGEPHSLLEWGLLGTPFYMAPEQARSEPMLDGRTDLFSLGCILFECLAARPPFVAEGPVAVLAKILFEDAPLLSSHLAKTPPALDAIIARLLAKEPAARPRDASAAASELRSLADAAARREASRPAVALTQNERRLVSVVLAAGGLEMGRGLNPGSTVLIRGGVAPPAAELERIAAEHDAALEVLGDGSLAAMLLGSGAPTDLAAGAARCALALRALLPGAQLALVTGWEVFTGHQPLGRVIDRAADLLHTRAYDAGGVLVDPMTAALLDERFVLAGEDASLTLVRVREAAGEVRRLLGKPTAFLGRARELDTLEALWDECVATPHARAALIAGAAGAGKSRVRSELVRRLKARGGAVEVWTARGDPTRRRAPLGLLAQLVRRAAHLAEGEPIDRGRQKLAARVARRVEPAMQGRVREFLGELIGIPFPAEGSPQLRAARRAPMLMGDQIRRACLDFVDAECRSHPVLIVLEDLQWGDQPTVDFLDAALRVLADRPLVALAVARREVTEVFPALWSERGLTTLELGKLPPDACEQIVRRALGEALSDEQVAVLVARSAQNPFLLEELVRAVHEGRADEVPDTVLAVMQSRLATLVPEARHLLRAASLFGEVFWRGALAALVGDPPDLAERLTALERREWIVRRSDSKFHGEVEYAFLHGLIREAAYEMLTEEDQALGHRLAAEWLSQAGETDAMVLAEHFEQGAQPARAIGCFRAAAQQALGANDLTAAIARVERAIACGPRDSELGELCLIRAEAHRWQGSFAEARQWAERALGMFSLASEGWLLALREESASIIAPHGRDRLLNIADRLNDVWSDAPSVSSALAVATVWVAIRLYEFSERERAEAFHTRLEGIEAQLVAEPIALGSIAMESAFRQGLMLVDVSVCGEKLLAAAQRFDDAGDLRNAHYMRANLGHVYNEVGAYEENVTLLGGLRREAERLGLWYIAATATNHLCKAQLALGLLGEAESSAREALDQFAKQGELRMAAVTRAYLAMTLRQAGKVEQAEREATDAIETLRHIPTLEPFALAVLASVRLARGHAAEALDLARRAMKAAAEAEEGEALIRLVHAEALKAVGDDAGAQRAITDAAGRLLERAGAIANEARRKSFLERVPENARTLLLARSWPQADG